MVSKHSELTKRQARDHYRRFASLSSCTAPPPSHREVGSSSRHRTAPPPSRMQKVGSSNCRRTAPRPSRQEEASLDDSMEMWVMVPPPPTRLVDPPPPPPPLTCLEVALSSDESPLGLLGL
jgi:hypothetical protein